MIRTFFKGFFGVLMALMTAVAVSAHAMTFDLSNGNIKYVDDTKKQVIQTARVRKSEQSTKQFEKLKVKRSELNALRAFHAT